MIFHPLSNTWGIFLCSKKADLSYLLFPLQTGSPFRILRRQESDFFTPSTIMKKKLNSRYKRVLHLAHKAKIMLIRGLDWVDRIPVAVRIPLGIVLLLLGFISIRNPLINGILLMLIGARMLGKTTFKKVYARISKMFSKTYQNLRSALYDTLKN